MHIVAHQSAGMESMTSLAMRSGLMGPYLNGHLPLSNASSAASHHRASPALSNRSSTAGDEEANSPVSAKSKELMSSPGSNHHQQYKCPLCQETLPCQKDFTSHIRGHNEVKPLPDPNDPTGQAKVYYCCLCGKMLSSFSSLDRHMLVHSGERPFSCELCGQTFTTNGNMHRHKRTHGSRDSHESDASSGGSSGGGGGGSKRGGRKRKVSLEQPAATQLDSGIKRQQQPTEQRDMNLLSALPGGKRCPLCPDTFFSELSLEAHIHTVHPGQEIKCDECSSVFPAYNFLKLHRNIYHHKSSFASSFPSLSTLTSLSTMASMNAFKAAAAAEEERIIETKEQQQQQPILDLSPPAKDVIVSPKKHQQQQQNNDISCLPGPQNLTPMSQDQISIADSMDHDENEGLLREMKLKGEFPCRVCPAVYPNLRALKGHNKEHLNKAPYSCNVAQCLYSSCDKSTLARHMRMHTGEKPFECKECSFGFTTKANCERHVKNKHGKNSRNEIRDAIVIHETDENSMKDQSDESLSLSLLQSPVKAVPKKEEGSSIKKNSKPSSLFAPYAASLFRPVSSHKEEPDSKEDLFIGGDAPLDLSRPTVEAPSFKDAKFFLHEKEIKPETKPFLPSSISPLAGQMPLPFLFQHLAATGNFDLTAYLLAQQEMLMRRQREAMQQRLQQQQQQPAKDPASFLLHLSSLQSSLSRQHQPLSPMVSPCKPAVSPVQLPEKTLQGKQQNDADYKMVIKNGVLMKKQKQRRYRTERPYGCDHCKARFTLRSNMERHVKQQHPEHYGKLRRTVDSGNNRNEDDWNGDDEMMEEEMEEKEEEEEEEEEEEDEEEEPLVVDDEKICDNADEEDEDGYLDNEDEVDSDETSGSSDAEGSDRKKSAYSCAPNKIPCPYCNRLFPWSSSLNRHILTHTGQKPYKCAECPLWFTTKSNCDRHLVRKHGSNNNNEKEVKNVPERPFKCQLCPSSTFSSEAKLRRHRYKKHCTNEQQQPHLQHEEEKEEKEEEGELDSSKESMLSDCPFKCHLCDDSFGERREAITHLKLSHPSEYEALATKGAFEVASSDLMMPQQLVREAEAESESFDQLRGKFPDYVNRKVVCLFCLRKFWSAEDLRRHVRTHTGERPYSCDICQRRFTLKHSMLRHRKKHDSGVSSEESDSEEDRSNYTSSLGDARSSSPEEANVAKQQQLQSGDAKKKRANLMDKINRLSSVVNDKSSSCVEDAL